MSKEDKQRDGESLGSRRDRPHSPDGWGSSPRDSGAEGVGCQAPHDGSGEHLGKRGES